MSRTGATLMAVAVAAVLAAGCGSSSSSGLPGGSVSPAPATSSPAAPHSAAVLAARLKADGVPVQKLIVYTPSTDPNAEMGRQGGYTSKVAWLDPRAVKAYRVANSDMAQYGPLGNPGDRGSIENGGGIEVFPDQASADRRLSLLKSFTPPLSDGYDVQAGTAILRLSQYLTPAQAHRMESLFSVVVEQP
jgi:hypothetical protein